MFVTSIILVCLGTVGAVFIPWLSPILIVLMYKSMDVGVGPFLVLFVCSVTATMTTTAMRFLNHKIHQYLDRQTRNNQEKHGRTRRLRRWFDHKFSIIYNKHILFVAVAIGSGSMIPDLFLVEFGRIKMKFPLFISAIAVGKLATYTIMLFGTDGILRFLGF